MSPAVKYQKLSKQDLFAAIQAHMVYVIMRVIDGSREPLGWNHEMLLIGGVPEIPFT